MAFAAVSLRLACWLAPLHDDYHVPPFLASVPSPLRHATLKTVTVHSDLHKVAPSMILGRQDLVKGFGF